MVPTALIVDDNASLAYFTACILKQEMEELTVLTAACCEEARVLADEHQPSVCIVDLKLPDGDGLEFIGELRQRIPGMAPILITASPLPGGPNREVFGLLVKPYDIETLTDLVRRALNPDDSGSGRAPSEHFRHEMGSSSAQYDFHHVQNRLSGLLAGIRALRLELHAVADDPSQVRQTIDEFTDRLSAMVKDAAETLKRKV